jgi:hypothetical protein
VRVPLSLGWLPARKESSRGDVAKHRLAEPEQPPKRDRLVCIYLGEPSSAESAVRECRVTNPPCGAQVLVPMLMVPLIESGELVASCRRCNGGRPLKMHPREMDYLRRHGLLNAALARLAQINEEFGCEPESDPDPLTAQ